jgi:hypothetical protein
MNRKTALRVIEPRHIASDLEEGLLFVRDMGEAVIAAASAISHQKLFEQLAFLKRPKN